jgi:enolase-phosphatase E1
MIQFTGALALLDIEGTVCPLSYVKEFLYPYARAHLVSFLERRGTEPNAVEALQRMFAEGRAGSEKMGATRGISEVATLANELMDRDAKQTGLKQLQGLIWEEGFASGELKSVVFPDVPPAISGWVAQGKKVRIFSSGSAPAQRVFFRHTTAGDLSGYLDGHHDTITGPKRAAASFAAIASQAGVATGEVIYISDVTAELDAAREAGCATALALRPGNAPNPPHTHPEIHSFVEIEIA